MKHPMKPQMKAVAVPSCTPVINLHFHGRADNQADAPSMEPMNPCDICGDWKDVDQGTRLCTDHTNTDIEGNPEKK